MSLVGVDHRVAVPGRRVDHDHRKSRGQLHVVLVEQVRLDDDDDAVDGLFAESVERDRDLALVGCGTGMRVIE